MDDPGRLAGEGERVQPDRPIRRGLWGARVPGGAGAVGVRLDLPDATRERRAERSQNGESRALRQLWEAPDHSASRAVVQRRVLEDLPPLDLVGHVLDVDLDAVARPGHDGAPPMCWARAMPYEPPRPLQHPVDAIDARDAPAARALQVPREAPGAIPRPLTPPAEAPSHPNPHLPGVAVGPAGAIRETQPIPPARRVAVLPRVVRLPGDPEEDAGVRDRSELLCLAEPVQPLSNPLFPDTVWHG